MSQQNAPLNPASQTLCIIGAGGFGREVYSLFRTSLLGTGNYAEIVFAEEDAFYQSRDVQGAAVHVLSYAARQPWAFVVAIGAPDVRSRIVQEFPDLCYVSITHPTALIGDAVELGAGSIVCAYTVLTSNIRVGRHAHLNLNTTIGHDTIAGDFLTTAPAAHISGHCRLGDNVYLGSGAILRQCIEVSSGAKVGAGAVVLHNINEAGTYVGVPARRVR